jgi:hypothetical protein
MNDQWGAAGPLLGPVLSPLAATEDSPDIRHPRFFVQPMKIQRERIQAAGCAVGASRPCASPDSYTSDPSRGSRINLGRTWQCPVPQFVVSLFARFPLLPRLSGPNFEFGHNISVPRSLRSDFVPSPQLAKARAFGFAFDHAQDLSSRLRASHLVSETQAVAGRHSHDHS